MLLFGNDKFSNADSSNDIVIVPPKPDSLGHFDEFSYSNLYACYDDYQYRHDAAPKFTNLNSRNALAPQSSAIAAAAADTMPLSANSPSLISHSSSSLSSDSKSNGSECFGNITGSDPPSLRTINLGQYSNNNNSTSMSTKTAITRDPRNGAFTFQVHAEYDLLLHVQKDLLLLENQRSYDSIHLSEHIMHSIDEYCLKKQWMYHIGREKGIAVSRFLQSKLEKWYKENVINNRHCAGGTDEANKVRAVLMSHADVHTQLTLISFHALYSTLSSSPPPRQRRTSHIVRIIDTYIHLCRAGYILWLLGPSPRCYAT